MTLNRFTSDGISFLHEKEKIQNNIKQLYWPHIRAKGYYIIVRPYVRESLNDGLMIPEAMRFEDQHHSTVAQVIDIGPIAYTDEKVCGGMSWAEIGDWVFVPRVAGVRVALKKPKPDGTTEDIMLRIVKEDDIISVVNDPSAWEIRISHTKF